MLLDALKKTKPLTFGILNMQLEIKINLDNAAYAETLGWELGENLQYVIERIGQGIKESVIHDTNGNKTGYWRIES
jgi:hypothetical protein